VYRTFACLIFLILSAGFLVTQSHALTSGAESLSGESGSAGQGSAVSPFLSIGIDGHYRVGRWTGIRVKDSGQQTIVRTRDGDGVRVEFGNRQIQSKRSEWVYVMPGSESAPLTIIRDGKSLGKDRLPPAGSPSRGPAMLPPDMPWTIVFGDPLGLNAIGKNDLLGRDATVAVTVPTQSETQDLPDASIGYDAVDMMLVTGSGAGVLSQLSDSQSKAIVDWVTGGGRMMITLGKSSKDLLNAAPWIADLLPFQPDQIVAINPSAIETYTSTQTQLDSYQGIKLPRDQGQVLVMGRTTLRTITPVASQFNVGFGTVVVVAADLETEPFADWPQRFDFVTAMAGPVVLPPDASQQIQSRRTAYNDLAGQLRLTLDQFSIRRGAGFSLIALVLMGVIAAIGPLDYLLVNRLLGRPLLGWFSFPLTVVAVSGLLVWQSERSLQSVAPETPGLDSDQQIQCNRLEVFDIDAVENPGLGRGESVGFIYSHDADRLNVHSRVGDGLGPIVTDVQSTAAAFGYPGESFGGIQIALEDTRLPTYAATSSLDDRLGDPILSGLPLAPRSSKGVFHRFRFRTQIGDAAPMARRRGSELLQGKLVNPLPIDLLDGMLIFRNWVYLLPTRFKAGSTVESMKELRQKNFRWLLSRQQAIESSSQNEAWDPTASDRLDRLSEMLMFHRVAGGSTYTGLGNKALSHLDLSTTLADDRCILVGRAEEPLINLELESMTSVGSANATPTEKLSPAGQTRSLIRIVLPVETKKTF
jgi:hypothetical protein